MRRSGGRSGRAVSASERAYGALMRAYPEDVRTGYGREMAQCFGDLCRREAGRRGLLGLVLLWAHTLPELLWTALKERSAVLARHHYAPVSSAAAAKAAGLCALLGGVAGAAYPAYFLTAAPVIDALSPPGYQGYWAGWVGNVLFLLLVYPAMALCALGAFGLYVPLAARPGGPGVLARAGAALACVCAASFLVLAAVDGAKVLVSGLDAAFGYYQPLWEQRLVGVLSYAGLLGWILGPLLLGAAAYGARVLPGRLRALPLGAAVLVPVGLGLHVALSRLGAGSGGEGYGLYLAGTLSQVLPYAGFAVFGLVLLRRRAAADDGNRAATDAAGTGGFARRLAVFVDRGGAPARGVRTGSAAAEAAREKELLRALASRGELTVAGAALETSLTVEEAERMLSALAAKGHLEVRVARGRLLYSLWEGDAPDA